MFIFQLDKAAFTLAYPTAPTAPAAAQNGQQTNGTQPPLKPLRVRYVTGSIL